MNLEPLRKAIGSLHSCIIASHVDPEGDAIGSILALGMALENLGKDVAFYNESGVPRALRFLPGADRVMTRIDSVNEYDCIFIVDCGEIERIGRLRHRLEKLNIINIDHHLTNSGFGDLNYVDAEAAAAGLVVYEILRGLDIPVTPPMAMNLYTAIMVDTGSFRYSSTSPRSLAAAAELLSAGGFDPWDVARNVYETFPLQRMKILGEALGTLELACDGKVAFMHVTRSMLQACGATEDLVEGFVNFGRSIEGVEVAVFFREKDDDAWKLSIRSKGSIDVSAIGGKLGGGGHRNAAGCKMQGSLPEAKKKFIQTLQEQYEWHSLTR